jgi:DNA polymerase-4
MILHIDMDAFFASVEQQINPNLRGRPVIVGARDGKFNTVVTAASYEAKAYGISSGMPSWKALKICPHAEFVACDSVRYTYISREIFELLKDYAPMVEHTTIDEFDLEISGLEPFFGPPLELGKTIKKRIREAYGLSCSVGIAATWILAKLGTKIRKPDGLILIDDANLDSLIHDLPVEKICGIGPALTAHLQNLGIMTCDQLKATAENILTDNFGRTTGRWLYHALRTNLNLTWQKGDIDTREIPKSVGHSYTLPRETYDQNTIQSWLRMLSEMVGERTRKYGLLGHTVSLWINSKNESFLRQKTFRMPTDDGQEIFNRARAILSQKKPRISSMRALGVILSGLQKNQAPPLLVEQKRREALLASCDKINAHFGDWTIHPASIAGMSRE